MPSPAEDQWLAVKMCNQEVTNCETKAIQNPSVLTVCGTPVIMTDIPGSTHGPGKNITLYYCVISCIEMIMMMMKMRVMMTIMIIIIIIIIIIYYDNYYDNNGDDDDDDDDDDDA